jgi:aminoglycoside 6'-N-acetyltransferase I
MKPVKAGTAFMKHFERHRVRPVTPHDAALWAQLRFNLWSESSIEDHAAEIEQYFAGELDEPQAVFFAETDDGNILGLVELSIRATVPGGVSDRVGFIEGLFVVPAARHLGVARVLVRASREWARSLGCVEFASDRAERFIIDSRYSSSSGGASNY